MRESSVISRQVLAVLVAQADVTVSRGVVNAILLLGAVMAIVVGWAFYELRRRRRIALRLDRVGALEGSPRYPAATAHSKEDFDAMIDGIALDERLPAIAARMEAIAAEERDRESTDG